MNGSILQINLTQLFYLPLFSKLKDHNPLEKEFTDYAKLLNCGLSQQEALKKMRLKDVPPSGVDKYNYLKGIWEEEQMSTFRDYYQVVQQQGCCFNTGSSAKSDGILPQQRNRHVKTRMYTSQFSKHLSSQVNKFFPFVESDKDLHDKIRDDMTGGPSIVFTRKAVVDQIYIRNSENICKFMVGIDASQLYPFSLCQEMPTGLYTRWELDAKFSKIQSSNQ